MQDRETTEISISGVRRLLASESSRGDGILEFVDNLLGAVLALSPAVAGPAALPLLALIEPKNELMKAAKAAVHKLSRTKQDDFNDRATRIAAANCLIIYTAYFDTLALKFPQIMKDVGLKNYEKIHLVIEASRQTYSEQADSPANILQPSQDSTPADEPIKVPHPADGPREAAASRRRLYSYLSQAVLHFFDGLVVWEKIAPGKRDEVRKLINDEIPDLAVAAYDAQYLTLAIEFPEFFVWATLTEARQTQVVALKISTQLQASRDLVIAASESIDVGLRNLAEAISANTQAGMLSDESPAAHMADALHRAYEDRISLPVIEDSYDEAEQDTLQLNFPSKRDAFVPQAYKVTRYVPGQTRLDSEKQWENLEALDDLGPFIVRYLQTAYSTETPLLILGHPGSGKSLLTELISARLAYPTYTTVRVELRDIDADAELQGQIEEQMKNETGRPVGWVEFAEALKATPPVVILDGYDELLQASGKVFADYLQSVRRFQRRESVQGRPVRVIVTSRLTLIDKASIPADSTIVRLLDFDPTRQQRWINVWNQCNKQYFETTNIAPFSMPDNAKVSHLAGQPLLLLMLAVYDSDSNQLSQDSNIDQTVLYDSLLRRFIYRERAKGSEGKNFTCLASLEQNKVIDRDMTRLGVAAIGMFNRQTVHTQQSELNAEIEYFGLEQVVRSSTGRQMTQADLLLGSFFFIHESRTKGEKDSERTPGTSAFEFLHNTFGEFLTADFMLNRISEVLLGIQELKTSANLRSMLPAKLTAMSEDWLACLIHTPLHTRPVILAMLKEWSGHFLNHSQPGRPELLSSLRMLVTAQVRAILDGYSLIDLRERDHKPSPYPRLPMLGHLAIYSLNLIELYVVLSENGAVLTDAELGSDSGGCRPWDKLVSLWRTWLSVEALDEAATILRTRRVGGELKFGAQDSLDVRHWQGRLGLIYSSALGLADRIAAGLAGICLADLDGAQSETIHDIEAMLLSEGVSLSPLTQAQIALATNVGDTSPMAQMVTPYVDEGQIGGKEERQFTPNLMRMYELIARSPVSSRLLQEFWCDAGSLRQVAQLQSRYQVELLVALRTTLEPRWLPSLLRAPDSSSREADREGTRDLWQDVLRSTSAAPLLRAAVNLLPAMYLSQIGAIIGDMHPRRFDAFDAETAALVAVVGDMAGDNKTRELGLDALVNGLRTDRSWRLDKMPLATFGHLVNMLVNARHLTEYRLRILRMLKGEATRRESEEGRENVGPRTRTRIGGVLGTMEFRVQCARLGLFEGRDIVGQLGDMLHDFITLPSIEFYRIVLLFFRLAREQDHPEWARDFIELYGKRQESDLVEYPWPSLREATDGNLWLLQLVSAERTHFSAAEMDDIAWAQNLLGNA